MDFNKWSNERFSFIIDADLRVLAVNSAKSAWVHQQKQIIQLKEELEKERSFTNFVADMGQDGFILQPAFLISKAKQRQEERTIKEL